MRVEGFVGNLEFRVLPGLGTGVAQGYFEGSRFAQD